MENKFSLCGKTALITGGGSGLGFGIAKVFVESGAKVVIVGRDVSRLSAACEMLGPSCKYVPFDITDLPHIPSLVSEVESIFGPIDILVNNAGKHLKKAFTETTDSEYLDMLNVHLLSSFAMIREIGRGMMSRNSGSILMISSMSAAMSMDRVVAYSTAKTAVLGLMRGVLAELSGYNVRVNAIAPGWIESPMLHKAIDDDPSRKSRILNRIPSHQFGSPDDIGYAALYLCSDAGRYVNGVFLPVDGGAVSGF